MARGKDRHDAHMAAVMALGKDLTRRAGSACELCGASADLRPVEVPPEPEEPDLDHALLACATCRDVLQSKRLPRDTDGLRFLETTMWSEVAPVQVSVVRLLRRLRDEAEVGWATEALDGLWLSEEIEARL